LIDNFYPALSACVIFIGGFLSAGWALSREVNEITEKYQDRVYSAKALAKARFATDLLSLHGFIQKSKAGKKKITTKDLMDQTYVGKITALYDLVKREKDVMDYYDSMWRSCSQGAKGMIAGGLLLAIIPVLLIFYSADLSNTFISIGFLVVIFAGFAAYASGLRIASYWRNRERLLKMLDEDANMQEQQPEAETE